MIHFFASLATFTKSPVLWMLQITYIQNFSTFFIPTSYEFNKPPEKRPLMRNYRSGVFCSYVGAMIRYSWKYSVLPKKSRRRLSELIPTCRECDLSSKCLLIDFNFAYITWELWLIFLHSFHLTAGSSSLSFAHQPISHYVFAFPSTFLKMITCLKS